MKKIAGYAVGVVVFFTLTFSLQAAQKTIISFCGSASKPAMEEAARVFGSETGKRVELNFSGSGTMLAQFEAVQTG